jgi:arylsulfatase A-like enzyme
LKNSHIAPDPRLRGCDLKTEIPVGREIFAKMETVMVKDKVKYSILADGFKLIHTPLDDRYELYNMKNDFAEEHDLANDPHHRQRNEDLKVRLKRMLEQDLLQLGTIKSPKLTDEEREKLESLGYLRKEAF